MNYLGLRYNTTIFYTNYTLSVHFVWIIKGICLFLHPKGLFVPLFCMIRWSRIASCHNVWTMDNGQMDKLVNEAVWVLCCVII